MTVIERVGDKAADALLWGFASMKATTTAAVVLSAK
jgi:hypothetical protein